MPAVSQYQGLFRGIIPCLAEARYGYYMLVRREVCDDWISRMGIAHSAAGRHRSSLPGMRFWCLERCLDAHCATS